MLLVASLQRQRDAALVCIRSIQLWTRAGGDQGDVQKDDLPYLVKSK